MATFVVYDLTTGVLAGKYQVLPDDYLADAEASHTLPTQGSLVIDESVTPVLDTSQFIVHNGALVAVDPLSSAQVTQIQIVQRSYLAYINNGFVSSALGTPHIYPNTADDQFNLTASIVASLIPGLPSTWSTIFLCGTTATPSVWNYVSHNAAQIQQVGLDSLAYSVAAKTKQATLLAEIQASTTVTAVQSFVW